MKPKLSKLVQAFQDEAARQYPNEACGFVVAKGKKQQFVPCVNSSASPSNEFEISPEEYQRASEVGEIIAIWHSHVNINSQPSEIDLVECENSEVPWFITGVSQCDDGSFMFTDTSTTEPSGYELDYIGRPYSYGVIDCYSLVVDYYKREFGIVLPRLPENRATRFWEENPPKALMEEACESIGLDRVDGDQPQIGDLFLIQTEGSVANHVAVYIGDDMILHHCENRLSGRTIYGGYWHKHTIRHYRHPEVGKTNGIDEGNP
jgi:proteasome lid subunit RPN8/RPN11